MFDKYLLDFHKHVLWLHLSIDIVVFVELAVVLDDLLSLVLVCNKPLLDAFNVIVTSPTGLPPLQQPIRHHFLTALQMEDEWKVNLVAHKLFPLGKVLDISGKPVDQEATSLEACLLHGFFEKTDSDVTGYNFSFFDVVLNDLSILRPLSFSFFSEQVTGREMDEFELFFDAVTLGAFARPRPSKDEDNGCLFSLHQQNKI